MSPVTPAEPRELARAKLDDVTCVAWNDGSISVEIDDPNTARPSEYGRLLLLDRKNARTVSSLIIAVLVRSRMR